LIPGSNGWGTAHLENARQERVACRGIRAVVADLEYLHIGDQPLLCRHARVAVRRRVVMTSTPSCAFCADSGPILPAAARAGKEVATATNIATTNHAGTPASSRTAGKTKEGASCSSRAPPSTERAGPMPGDVSERTRRSLELWLRRPHSGRLAQSSQLPASNTETVLFPRLAT